MQPNKQLKFEDGDNIPALTLASQSSESTTTLLSRSSESATTFYSTNSSETQSEMLDVNTTLLSENRTTDLIFRQQAERSIGEEPSSLEMTNTQNNEIVDRSWSQDIPGIENLIPLQIERYTNTPVDPNFNLLMFRGDHILDSSIVQNLNENTDFLGLRRSYINALMSPDFEIGNTSAQHLAHAYLILGLQSNPVLFHQFVSGFDAFTSIPTDFNAFPNSITILYNGYGNIGYRGLLLFLGSVSMSNPVELQHTLATVIEQGYASENALNAAGDEGSRNLNNVSIIYRLLNQINPYLSINGLASLIYTNPAIFAGAVSILGFSGALLHDSSFLLRLLEGRISNQNVSLISDFIQRMQPTSTIAQNPQTSSSDLINILSQTSPQNDVGNVLNRFDRSYLSFRKVIEAVAKYWYQKD